MNGPVTYHLGKFPPNNIDWESLLPLITDTHRALGAYNGLLSAIPNPHILLFPLVVREAVLSSKIEGTNVSVSEVLEYEVGIVGNEDKRRDAMEVINYREALILASEQIKKRGFHLALLRNAHKVLFEEGSGKHKTPGAFRESQNWIGPPNSTLSTASFVPIGIEYLDSGIDAWIRYYKQENIKDVLVQLAIIHLEFEALHPFLDGNGRIGRILIPLFLFERNIISSPNFYMSGYLEANRDKYISMMKDVSKNDTWTEWCSFFLNGIFQQAEENRMKIQSILDLQKSLRDRVRNSTGSKYSPEVLDFLISFPIFDRNRLSSFSNQSKTTSTRIINKLVEAEIIKKIKDGSGNQGPIYVFEPLLEITG